jgi:serine/threonine-protein kinase
MTTDGHGPTRRIDGGGGGGGDLGPGDRVGRYRIEARLAGGGFGTVYRAVHEVLGRAAALKVLHPALAARRAPVLRFEQEARAAAGLRHPGIAEVYDIGELEDGRPFIALELLPGRSLADHLADRGALPIDEALAILAPVAEALAAAHAAGIIHRDVKASNVMLAGDRVVLLDFGIAKLLDPDAIRLTRTGETLGTPSVMAPEQLIGGPVDARTDVYGLGALAFHMLAGAPPFGAHEPDVLRALHRHGGRPRLAGRVDVPAAVDEAIGAALAVQPGDRPPGPLALVAALRSAIRPAAADAARAAAIYVDADGGGDPAALADADVVLAAAADRLTAAGFRCALDVGTGALYLLPAADGATAVAAAMTAARALAADLAGRRFGLCIHIGSVLIADGRIRGGELGRLAAWLPGAPFTGIVVTAAAAGLLGDAEK